MENDRNILRPVISTPVQYSVLPVKLSSLAKRLFDFLASLLGLVVLSPLFIFLAILLKRESPGPIFYRGPRVGRGGKVFWILKFRTMHEEAATYAGPGVTAQDDPRITHTGKWLRDTKLNELPQLWNVLVGEMSLVGPRPEDPAIVATWREEVRAEILSVRPGITSPASVAYHDEERRLNSASVMNDYLERILPDKLRLDRLYVRHHNFITDLDALFWTFVILIPRLGKQRISEGWLFGGPISRLVRRYINWTIIDFVVAFLSIGVVGVLWRMDGPLDIGVGKALKLATLLALLFGLFNTMLGLKIVSWSRAVAEDVFRLVVSCALVSLTVIVIQFLSMSEDVLPIGFMFATSLLVLFGFVAVRYRLRLVTGLASRWITWRDSGYGTGERVLVVGAGEGGEFATWLLKRPDFKRQYTITGFVDDHPSKQGMRIKGVKVLGTAADIPQLVKQHDIGVIFYAISRISPNDSQRILDTCKKTNLHMVMISDLLSALRSQLTTPPPLCEENYPYLIGSDANPASYGPALEETIDE